MATGALAGSETVVCRGMVVGGGGADRTKSRH